MRSVLDVNPNVDQRFRCELLEYRLWGKVRRAHALKGGWKDRESGEKIVRAEAWKQLVYLKNVKMEFEKKKYRCSPAGTGLFTCSIGRLWLFCLKAR